MSSLTAPFRPHGPPWAIAPRFRRRVGELQQTRCTDFFTFGMEEIVGAARSSADVVRRLRIQPPAGFNARLAASLPKITTKWAGIRVFEEPASPDRQVASSSQLRIPESSCAEPPDIFFEEARGKPYLVWRHQRKSEN